MKAAICEDEKVYSDMLSEQVKSYFKNAGEEAELTVFTDGAPLLSAYDNGASFDIVFLDIQLESSDGMDTAAKLREKDGLVTLIFVTGLEDRAVEGYAVDAFDYIVKSTMNDRLYKVLDRFLQERGKSTLSVTDADGGTVLLRFSDILWIESDGRGTEIKTASGTVRSAQPVSRFSALLPPEQFVETHKSVYVRIEAISRIENDTVEMLGGASLPLSRRRRKPVMSAVMRFVKGSMK